MQLERTQLQATRQIQPCVVPYFPPVLLQVIVITTDIGEIRAHETFPGPEFQIVLQTDRRTVFRTARQAIAIRAQAGGIPGQFAFQIASTEVQPPAFSELGAAARLRLQRFSHREPQAAGRCRQSCAGAQRR